MIRKISSPLNLSLREPELSRSLKALIVAAIAGGSLLLGGCPEDPMGPDNRMAMIALGHCDFELALRLTDLAIERGDVHQIQRAWMLKAAILRDSGDPAGAEAIYPDIETAWHAEKGNQLKPERRERDIKLLIGVAQSERLTNGLEANCQR